MGHIIIEAIRNAVLITGLVVVMMMMIESLNIESRGLVFKGLKKTKFGQVVIAALLGSIPGCMGGFATVSLYTHRMVSFGALVAMMIASSGDEAFVMLAMIPEQALILFAVLFVLAVLVGLAVDFVHGRIHAKSCSKHDHSDCGAKTDCNEGYMIHDSNHSERSGEAPSHTRHFGWKRMVMFVGLAIFIAALATGNLGHDHAAHSGHDHAAHSGHVHTSHEAIHPYPGHAHPHDDIHSHGDIHSHEMNHSHGDIHSHEGNHSDEGHENPEAGGLHINLLNEEWMNVLFAGLSVIVLMVLLFASDHFVEEHLWNHIIKKHLPTIFAWTFVVLLLLGFGLQHIDVDRWISDNVFLMIILAALIGIIPESGPHMIFVTLFAAGVVPFPVLVASSISQDGHASIPLLAESRKSFAWAKLINFFVAVVAGFVAMALV